MAEREELGKGKRPPKICHVPIRRMAPEAFRPVFGCLQDLHSTCASKLMFFLPTKLRKLIRLPCAFLFMLSTEHCRDRHYGPTFALFRWLRWFEPLHFLRMKLCRKLPFLMKRWIQPPLDSVGVFSINVFRKCYLNPIVNLITLLQFKICLVPFNPFTIPHLGINFLLQSESVS